MGCSRRRLKGFPPLVEGVASRSEIDLRANSLPPTHQFLLVFLGACHRPDVVMLACTPPILRNANHQRFVKLLMCISHGNSDIPSVRVFCTLRKLIRESATSNNFSKLSPTSPANSTGRMSFPRLARFGE